MYFFLNDFERFIVPILNRIQVKCQRFNWVTGPSRLLFAIGRDDGRGHGKISRRYSNTFLALIGF